MRTASVAKRSRAVVAVLGAVILSLQGGATAAVAPNLDNVVAYPSPFDARLNHTAITFANLTASATLRIYKLTGELVYESDITTADGSAVWNVTNKDNNNVASGLYIYLITNSDGQKKTGKIAILR